MISIIINHETFPITFKDTDLGAYFTESKIPDTSTNTGRTQILLDNNMMGLVIKNPDLFMRRVGWYFGRNSEISINPSLGIVEQYLSNDSGNARANIANFEKSLSHCNVFPQDYADMMLRTATKLGDDLRQTIGIFFCFIAMLRHIHSKNCGSDAIRRWSEFFSLNIPRLQVLYFVGAVMLLSQHNKKLRFLRSDRTIYDDYTQAFFSLRKEEANDIGRWLRNRSFDVAYFITSPTLCLVEKGGYSSRTIVASRDKFVGEFMGRLFAWGGEPHEGSCWALAPLPHVIDQNDERIASSIEEICRLSAPGRDSDENAVSTRLWNLIEITLRTITHDERAGLTQALNDYRIFHLIS